MKWSILANVIEYRMVAMNSPNIVLTKRVHKVSQHRSGIAGIEAMTMLSEHTFPRHSHDQFGFGVMTAGAQRSWSILGEVESGVGDVIMVNPGEIHDGAPIGGARGWHILYLDPELVMREVGEEYGKSDFAMCPVARDPQLGGDILRFFKEMELCSTDNMAKEEALLCCLMRILQKHGLDGPRKPPSSPPVLRAIRRLENAPEVSTSLGDLAASSGVSRFQLLRGFFRETGATPHAYLVQLRVRMARRFLAAGNSPAEAALLAGFADQSHLTRAFVRQFGITPGGYKTAIS